MDDSRIKAHALDRWANYLETGYGTLSASDCIERDRIHDIKQLSDEQRGLVDRIRQLAKEERGNE